MMLARDGHDVTVLERRPVLGGACVPEELWPGYRVSRAAYVVGLLRPAHSKTLQNPVSCLLAESPGIK